MKKSGNTANPMGGRNQQKLGQQGARQAGQHKRSEDPGNPGFNRFIMLGLIRQQRQLRVNEYRQQDCSHSIDHP